jgi:hypothetical protein
LPGRHAEYIGPSVTYRYSPQSLELSVFLWVSPAIRFIALFRTFARCSKRYGLSRKNIAMREPGICRLTLRYNLAGVTGYVMANSKDEVKVLFYIFSDSLAPAVITETLGLQPDEEWEKGSVIREDLERKTNAWAISAPADYVADILRQVDHIIARLAPVRERLLGIAPACHFELSCKTYIHEGPAAPGIHFGADVLQFLAGIGAEIDVEIYCLTQN